MELSCHCGGVTITLPHAPDEIIRCNCSVCRKTGFLALRYPENSVAVAGKVDGYVRNDMSDEPPCLTLWHCPSCGVVTHWTLLDEWPYDDMERPDRMGVNGRLLDPELAKSLPVREVDGASA
ncbi:GFA family protein [Sphingomicrobium sp. B8]|uniref:GFA family protein n=1 Tax=Sphingomicrobium clamense TaxID=2851013 RepID=A0ABS6V2B2_9SPHN|nr:GFA family protein [Sphingomicrobium sp. B8]